MSLQNKLAFALLATALTGCGFQPLYGTQGATSDPAMKVGIKIDPIEDNNPNGGHMGQQLRENIEDRLNVGGLPANPMYRLSATLSSAEGAIGVARDNTVSRYNVYLTSTYSLYRTSDGVRVSTGTVNEVSSYNNVTNAYFSTYESEQDAIKRGITELSEIYRQRIAAYLTGPNSGKPDSTALNPATPQNNMPLNPFNTQNPFSPYSNGGTGGSPFNNSPVLRNAN